MTQHVFLDTNVLLDVLARREPFYRAAQRIWTLAESRVLRASVSAISFNNCYYIIRKYGTREKADEALRLLRAVFEPVDLTARVLDRAMDAAWGDFEDAIQFHSALQVGANPLITRNPGDFSASGVDVLTPVEFLAQREAMPS